MSRFHTDVIILAAKYEDYGRTVRGEREYRVMGGDDWIWVDWVSGSGYINIFFIS